jgi:tRNA pseudouridine55 synthase
VRDVSGILLLDKPAGASSNQVLQQALRLFGAAKAGHTGSLDPLATGLLPICFGEATKIAGLLLGASKAYETECRLGVATDTDDADGAAIAERPVPPLSADQIRSVLAGLTGRIVQVPPVYSALKREGQPLYRLARSGVAVEAEPREVQVDRFELLEHDGVRLRLGVECGSGTYVRSLVRDLGERLGCGAHVTSLRRTWVEPFRQPRMFTFEALAAVGEAGPAALDALLLPLEAGLAAYPQVHVDESAALRLRQGQPARPVGPAAAGAAAAIDPQGRVVALVDVSADGGLRAIRGFRAGDPGD